MIEKPPEDPADHAVDFARRWAGLLEAYCTLRMQELGIPEHSLGTRDLGGDGRWTTFIVRERQGGNLWEGIAVNSGCLNPSLLKGEPGARVFARARLRDRIDAIIAHEYEEDRLGTHAAALKHGWKTELPIRAEAKRILKAMAR